jgi:hypothetical protein
VVIISTQKSQLPYEKTRFSGGGANARMIQLEKNDSWNNPPPSELLERTRAKSSSQQKLLRPRRSLQAK